MSLVPGGDALVPQAGWQGGQKVCASVGANDPAGHDHCRVTILTCQPRVLCPMLTHTPTTVGSTQPSLNA